MRIEESSVEHVEDGENGEVFSIIEDVRKPLT